MLGSRTSGLSFSRFSRFGRAARALLGVGVVGASMLLCMPAQAEPAFMEAKTKYPIVLVHGIFGFDKIGRIDYFYKIPADLEAGGATVRVASLSSLNSTEQRGEQLLRQVKAVLATTGAKKVNLVAHSHGGPTARYVAGVAPELVASVTSVAGVNKGSLIADIVEEKLDAKPKLKALVVKLTKDLAEAIAYFSGRNEPEDPLAALASLTTPGSLKFNKKFPQALPNDCNNGADMVNGVRYYSWSGYEHRTGRPIADAILGPLGDMFDGTLNDGLVSVCSSGLGKRVGFYNQNHLSEINHILGWIGDKTADPVAIYRAHANRLKVAGL